MLKIQTRQFGEISVAEDKVLTFPDGLIGFSQRQKFVLLMNDEDTDNNKIFWLQSIEEVDLALPIVNPFAIFEEYNPVVEDEWFRALGEHEEEDLLVFLTMAVPQDITRMTVNQKAPIIVNTKTNKACQIIVEGEQYLIRYPIYELLKEKKEKAGD